MPNRFSKDVWLITKKKKKKKEKCGSVNSNYTVNNHWFMNLFSTIIAGLKEFYPETDCQIYVLHVIIILHIQFPFLDRQFKEKVLATHVRFERKIFSLPPRPSPTGCEHRINKIAKFGKFKSFSQLFCILLLRLCIRHKEISSRNDGLGLILLSCLLIVWIPSQFRTWSRLSVRVHALTTLSTLPRFVWPSSLIVPTTTSLSSGWQSRKVIQLRQVVQMGRIWSTALNASLHFDHVVDSVHSDLGDWYKLHIL